MDRRSSLRLILGAAAAALVRCGSGEGNAPRSFDPALAQLRARAGRLRTPVPPTGVSEPLALGGARDGAFLALPSPGRKAALILLLHGATGSGARILERVRPQLPPRGLVVVAPDSRGATWTRGNLAEETAFVDSALALMFARYDIDRSRVFVAGHSDGASYALTLGLTNGDLFSRVVAISPGFAAVKTLSPQRPRIFVAHGTRDEILPIDETGRRVVAELLRAGYQVTFREFDGGHMLQPEIVTEAVRWLELS